MKRSSLDPSLYITMLGEVKPQSKGYNLGMLVQGSEASVKAFEAWCLDSLKNGFRTVSRKRDVMLWTRTPLGDRIEHNPPLVEIHLRLDFRDRGKYALTKLQWL